MPRRSICKLKESKLKGSFNFLLFFTLLSTLAFGCTSKKNKEKEKTPIPQKNININNPLVAKAIYPSLIENGTLTEIKVSLTNRGKYPIAITKIQIGEPRTTTNFNGTSSLKALNHKFQKDKKFNRKFFTDKKIAKRREHVVPEVHKLKAIIYPGKTNIYSLKAIVQNIEDSTYKNNLNIIYINFDKEWHQKIYLFTGKTKADQETLVDELYTISQKLPSKLEGNLVASVDLGKVKYKKLAINTKLKGWNLKGKNIKFRENVFLKNKNAWLYHDGITSFIAYEDGKQINVGKVNLPRVFTKTILKGKSQTIVIKETEYQTLKQEADEYKFTFNKNRFETRLTLRQLNDFFDKIHLKGYTIHKHGGILKIK